MKWEEIYLICFGVGLVLSFVFLLSGTFHLHLPGKFAGHHIGGHAHGANCAKTSGTELTHISPFNLLTTTAFLTWFGGTGYLLTHYYSVVTVLAFGIACAVGIVGASAVFTFLARVMAANERPLRDEDFEMVGVIGRVSSGIRESGTGEIVFSQNGKRRSAGARSESGAAVERGTEVVVTRYERGIAYVRPWGEFAREQGLEGHAKSAVDG
jgi:membrane protein implicated in regulation of membrane protease activity